MCALHTHTCYYIIFKSWTSFSFYLAQLIVIDVGNYVVMTCVCVCVRACVRACVRVRKLCGRLPSNLDTMIHLPLEFEIGIFCMRALCHCMIYLPSPHPTFSFLSENPLQPGKTPETLGDTSLRKTSWLLFRLYLVRQGKHCLFLGRFPRL